MSAALAPVRAELDRLNRRGRRIAFWWRDDDAVGHTPALDRLLEIAGSTGLPLALAVIPARTEPSLRPRLERSPDVAVLVHGWSHANHALPSEKPAEFGLDRPTAAMMAEAQLGLRRLAETFGPAALPVFVPPWNRIAPEMAGRLSDIGYHALSCFGGAGASLRGLRRLDTHLDPVAWRTTRSLAPIDAIAAGLRRALEGGGGEIGLLTHHLVFDEPLWDFCASLATLVRDHPAIERVPVAALLSRDRRGSALGGGLVGAAEVAA